MRAPVARHARDVPAEKRDGAGVGRELTGDEVEERRLARAVRPDDQTALARLDGEVDGVRHTEAAERLLELLHGERGHGRRRSEEHTSELQSHSDIVCRLLLEKKQISYSHTD